MGFTVKLYTFSKRDNSTKRPAANAGTEFSCVLKSGSGIMRPTLTFDFGIAKDPSNYNYAYIPAFDRYYFIEEWYFDRALWTATLKVDVLATYKTEIGSASLYVLRAAGANNGNIVDTLYPCKTGCTFDNEIKSNPWNTTPVPVIGVIGKGDQGGTSASTFGSMNYYALDPSTPSELTTLIDKLLTPTEIINTGHDFNDLDASYALQLSLVDPIQYIKTCVMIPVALTDITALDIARGIDVYSWNFSTGRKIHPASRIYKNYSFTLKKHPDTTARGNYVNSAPYTKITLTIPPYGCIDIDTSVTCNASTLDVDVEIDPTSGKGILVIKCNNIVLNRLEAQIGVPVSLSSVTRDYIGATSSAIGAVGGAVSAFMGNISGVLGAAGSIGNAVEAIMPRAQTIGSTGSFVANRGDFRLDYQFMRPVDDDNTHNGRPLCQMKTISTLSGYILVQDGDVAITGTSAEDAAVRNYLEGGFYYE